MDNYFVFYDIPVSIDVDVKAVRRLYISNSRQYHPDYHTMSSGQDQEAAIINSSINNRAYKTLIDEVLRVEHVLRLHDSLVEGDTVSQEFLIEMMEVNELLMEVEMGEGDHMITEIRQALGDHKDALDEELKDLASQELDTLVLSKLKDWYYKRKYIDRLEENVARVVLSRK